MPIIRTAQNSDFTKIPNEILQDRALSWKAKGLLAFLLSRPNDWRFYLTEIERHSTDGRASLQAGVKELTAAGYIARSERREAGKFAGHDYIIADSPQQKNRSGLTAAENPQRETRNGKTAAENPQLQRLTINKTDLNKTDLNKTEGKSGAPKIPYSQIVDLFHEHCPEMPRVLKMTDSRRRAIRARWRTCSDLAAWAEYFQKAAASDFLRGQNDRGWRADFDWLLSEANGVKVMEGRYDNRTQSDPIKAAIQRAMAMDEAEAKGEEVSWGWQ